MEEIWKEIPDYPDYKVSNFGNIMSKKYGDYRLLTPTPNSDGYLRVGLCKNNKHSTKRVHRLMAIAFIPNPENLSTVDHIDQNKTNNDLSNLRWATNYTQSMNKSNTRTDILETDPKERHNKLQSGYIQKIIDEKRFYCETCNISCQCKSVLENHYKTEIHNRILNFKPTTKHFCRECGVNCPSKSALERHMIGPKHKKRMENK